MKGYDEYNTILLPPRRPGSKLPQELLDAYSEQQKKKEEEEKAQEEARAKLAAEKGEEEGEEGSGGTQIVLPDVPSVHGSHNVEVKPPKDGML